MKRLYVILFSLFALLFSFYPKTTNATHILGGEVSWDCLSNGSYIFHAKIYVDCSGLPFSYIPTTLDVTGNPRPRNANNQNVGSITLLPDSSEWMTNNFGYLSPRKNDGTCTGLNVTYDCASSDQLIQYFPYKSDTIRLFGLPNASGWNFNLALPCCRPNYVSNIVSNGFQLITATLYRPQQSHASGICYESSPQFVDQPKYTFCRTLPSSMSFAAFDKDFDSLAYAWDRTFNVPVISPQAVPYSQGFSMTNPTPDTSFHPNNQAAKLDSLGQVSFEVHSGSPARSDYLVVVRVDAYRNGHRLSSIRREVPVAFFDCISTNNQPPRVNPPFYKGGTTFSYQDSVVVGNPVNINLSVRDTNRFNGIGQRLRVELRGQSLSRDLRNSRDCPLPSDTNCATVIIPPLYDTLRNEYYYSALTNWNSILSWQTDCEDLNPDGSARTHHFYVYAEDDNCPFPGQVLQILSLTVLPDTSVCQGTLTSLAESNDAFTNWGLYPNPSNGVVYIDRLEKQALNYEIYNLSGQKVLAHRLGPNEDEIQLPLEEGLYFVRFMDQEGYEKTFKVLRD